MIVSRPTEVVPIKRKNTVQNSVASSCCGWLECLTSMVCTHTKSKNIVQHGVIECEKHRLVQRFLSVWYGFCQKCHA